MASQPDRYPFERALRRFEAIVHQAQRTILAQIEAAVKAGELTTAAQRRAQLDAVTRTLAELSAIAQPLASRLVRDAWHQGAERALQQVRKLSVSTAEIPAAFSGVSREGVQALQASLLHRLDDASQTLGRRVEDVYAREQRYAAVRALLGAEGSPHAASQQLQVRLLHDATIRRTVRDSNVGFVDRAGKRWSLETYANMATRTVTREAVVHGAVARMASHGVAIARVSTHPGACPICVPFEGTLVALSPDAPSEWKGEAVSDTGEMPPFHPNCAHSLEPVSATIESLREELDLEPEGV